LGIDDFERACGAACFAPQIHKPALFPKTVKHPRSGRRIGIARWKCGDRLTQIHRGFSSSLSVRMARRCKPPRSRCDRQLVEIAKTAVQPSPLDHSRTPTAEYPGRRQVAPGCPMTGWDSSHEDREPSPTSWTPRLRSRPRRSRPACERGGQADFHRAGHRPLSTVLAPDRRFRSAAKSFCRTAYPRPDSRRTPAG